jgi:ABC-type dipeptide/oligopeptide/nickel transport system permease subunit
MTLMDPQNPSVAAGTDIVPPAGGDAGHDLGAARPFRKDVWRRFRKNKLAMVGLTFVILLVLVAVFAPLIAPYTPIERTSEFRASPSLDHLFGTDRIGRDVFSRVIYGARVSLKVGILATSIALFIGVVLGSVAGFFGGALDTLIMRVTDVFLAIPYIILAIAIAVVLGRGENTVIAVLGLTGWLAVCRIVRSSFLSLKQQEYVEAATALGASKARTMFRHILPNALQPIIVYGTVAIGGVILSEAALSFLNVGAVPPTPAWGLMVGEGRGDLVNDPHLLFFPGAAIFVTVLSFVFVGDGLRDALDAKLK